MNQQDGNGMFAVRIYTTKDLSSRALFFAGENIVRPQPDIRSLGKVEQAWLRFEDGDPVQMRARPQAGEDTLLADVDTTSLLPGLIKAVESGSRIQVGMKLRGVSGEVVYSANAAVSEDRKLEFRSCIKEILSRAVVAPK